MRYLAQAFELVARGRVFLRIGRVDLQDCEIELVNVVGRLVRDGGGEMTFFFRDISLRAREPAGDDVVGGFVPVGRLDPVECVARDIELAKAQGGGGEVELAIEPRVESRDLGAPGHRLGVVFFFGRFGQNAAGFDGIGIDLEGLPGEAIGGLELAVLELVGGLGKEARFVPAAPAFAYRREGEEADPETEHDEEGDEKGAADSQPLLPGRGCGVLRRTRFGCFDIVALSIVAQS